MADPAFATEAELLTGLQAGDQAAYRQLVDLNSANVYNVAMKLLGDEHEAEDVLQETFLSAFGSIERFQGRSKLSTWLYRIATNASLMRLRKRPKTTTISLDYTGTDEDWGHDRVSRHLVDWSAVPDAQLLTSEAQGEMEMAVAALPKSLRATFVLRDIQGLSGAETAEILGLSVQAVKNRLHRARLWLRDQLSGYFAERAGHLHMPG